MTTATAKNLALGVLGAAVIGLGAVVAVDHVAAPAPAAPAPVAAQLEGSSSPFATMDRAGGGMKVLQQLSQVIGVPQATIVADLRKGETLAQIAGPKTAALQSDIVSMIKQQLDKAESKGVLTSAQESRLMSDANDSVSVLLNAKIGELFTADH